MAHDPQKLSLVLGEWGDDAAHWLGRALASATLQDLHKQWLHGAKLYRIMHEGECVGAYLLRVDSTARGQQGVIVAAAAELRGVDMIQTVGKASLGDKTMLDAMLPFADALEAAVAAGTPLAQAWAQAAEVAEKAAQATATLRPKVGRARPLAERSVGTPDPGAISFAMCARVVASAE